MHDRGFLLYDLSVPNWILNNKKELILTDFDFATHYTEKTDHRQNAHEMGLKLNADVQQLALMTFSEMLGDRVTKVYGKDV